MQRKGDSRMKKMLDELRYIFNRQQKIGLLFLLVAIGIGTLLELLGVTAIMPFIDVVMNPEAIQKNGILSGYMNYFILILMSLLWCFWQLL